MLKQPPWLCRFHTSHQTKCLKIVYSSAFINTKNNFSTTFLPHPDILWGTKDTKVCQNTQLHVVRNGTLSLWCVYVRKVRRWLSYFGKTLHPKQCYDHINKIIATDRLLLAITTLSPTPPPPYLHCEVFFPCWVGRLFASLCFSWRLTIYTKFKKCVWIARKQTSRSLKTGGLNWNKNKTTHNNF